MQVASEMNFTTLIVDGLSKVAGFAQFPSERRFFIDNLLVRIHLIIEIFWWTGLAPWELELSFPGSLTFIFLAVCFCLTRQSCKAEAHEAGCSHFMDNDAVAKV